MGLNIGSLPCNVVRFYSSTVPSCQIRDIDNVNMTELRRIPVILSPVNILLSAFDMHLWYAAG